MAFLSYFLNPSKQKRKIFSEDSHYYYFLIAAITSLTTVLNVMAILLRYQDLAPLVLFLAMCLLIGLPMIMCQIVLAQYSRTNKIFRISPFWVGTQYAIAVFILLQVFVEVYYASIMLEYAEHVITGDIRWTNCSYFKADDTCKDEPDEVTKYLTCCSYEERFILRECVVQRELKFVSYDYYQKEIGVILSDNGWILNAKNIFNKALIWTIIYHLLMLELNTLGKCVKMLTNIFIALSCYVIFLTFWLPGSTLALGSILHISTSSYVDFQLYGNFYMQILNTYELASGVIIFYTSWTKKHRNITRDAVFVYIFRLLLSLIFLVWLIGLLGVVANKYGVTDFDCYRAMHYRTNAYPLITEVLDMFPSPRFQMAIFFPIYCLQQILHITLLLLVIVEQFHQVKKWILVLLICCIGFSMSIPMKLYKDYTILLKIFGLESLRVVIILSFSLAVFVFYGASNLCDDMAFMMGYPPIAFWKYTWYLYVPLITILSYASLKETAHIKFFLKKELWFVAYIIYGCFIGIIVLGMIIQMVCYAVHCKFLSVFKPHKKWGPADHSKRLYRHFFVARNTERSRDPNYKCNHICLREFKAVKQKEKLLQRKRQAYFEFMKSTQIVSKPRSSDFQSSSMVYGREDFN